VFLAGTIAHSTRRPTLWPRVVCYHELFHLAVVVSGAAYFLDVVRFVAPPAPP
jgi:predicted membrane channel-forming protein YqfA (hemolysin III family)